jgi:hypothetical protein
MDKQNIIASGQIRTVSHSVVYIVHALVYPIARLARSDQ